MWKCGICDAEVEDDDAEQIYDVGTAVRIQKMLRFPDGSMRLLGQGIARCRIEAVLQEEPYLRAAVSAMPEEPADDAETVLGTIE